MPADPVERMVTGQDDILVAIRHTLAQPLSVGHRVVVGLSGGLDSVVLLHALVRLSPEMAFVVSAVHVHHGLSPNADAWAAFCTAICEDLGVPCHVVRVQLPDATGKGVERVARESRYAAFESAPGDILCLGHHQNDRAETFLLNLCRGAGATGLAGLPKARLLGAKHLLRPLIDLPRAALQAWATTQQLRWIEDESNSDCRYRRNYVRHQVLPTMTAAFPGVVRVLSRTADQMQEQAALLDRLAVVDAGGCRDASGHLSVQSLQRLPEPATRNLLRHALTQAGVPIPAARRLMTLTAQVMSARLPSAVLVHFGGVGVHVWRDHIWIDRAMIHTLPCEEGLSSGVRHWPDGRLQISGVLDANSNVYIAAIGQGQRFQPRGRCRDVVSELLREQGIPPWVRPRLPGIWQAGRLLWVAGLGWSNSASGQSIAQSCSVLWDVNPVVRL